MNKLVQKAKHEVTAALWRRTCGIHLDRGAIEHIFTIMSLPDKLLRNVGKITAIKLLQITV